MAITWANTLSSSSRGSNNAGLELGEAAYPKGGSGFWAGIQPMGDLMGIEDRQGTFGRGRGKHAVADWVATAIGGAGTAFLEAAATAPSTGVVVSRATSNHDGYGFQWSKDGGTTISNIFVPTASQLILCYFRLKMDNASTDAHTKSEFFCGLASTDTTLYADIGTTPATCDAIGFVKASGAATMTGILQKAGTQTASAALSNSLVDNTYISLGFRVNGVSSVEFWQGTTPFNMTKVLTQATVTNIATTKMALSWAFGTSEAAAMTAYLQHAVCFAEAL